MKLEAGRCVWWMGLFVKVYEAGGWVALLGDEYWLEVGAIEKHGFVWEAPR